MKKINLLGIGLLLLSNLPIQADTDVVTPEPLLIEVYRSPSCSCCGKWLQHLKEKGFTIKDHLTQDMQIIKQKYAVPTSLASCHTALINSYVIEGHVPARDIKRMLQSKSAITGLSVPGMPVGTPGMEMGGQKQAYQVISFSKQNENKVFSSYEAK